MERTYENLEKAGGIKALKVLLPGDIIYHIKGYVLEVVERQEIDLSAWNRDLSAAGSDGEMMSFNFEEIEAIALVDNKAVNTRVEEPFVKNLFVAADQEDVSENILRHRNYTDALNSYLSLPNTAQKVLGICSIKHGNQILVRCKHGLNVLLKDCMLVDGWKNPEVFSFISYLEINLMLQEPHSMAYKLTNGQGYFIIRTFDEGYDYDWFDQNYCLIDGGQLDVTQSNYSMYDALKDLLEDIGCYSESIQLIDFNDLEEKAEEANRL